MDRTGLNGHSRAQRKQRRCVCGNAAIDRTSTRPGPERREASVAMQETECDKERRPSEKRGRHDSASLIQIELSSKSNA